MNADFVISARAAAHCRFMMKTRGVSLIALGLLVMSSAHCDADLGVGDACTPEIEHDPSFTGFSEMEVSVESKSVQCRSSVCLVNHFRGRTDLPDGAQTDERCVAAQCAERRVSDAVYCSCRCANAEGKTDDGSVYCACPQHGFECKQLIARIGADDEGLTGAYCIKRGTEYDESQACLSKPDSCRP